MKIIGVTSLLTIAVLTLQAQAVPAVYAELENHYNSGAFQSCVRMSSRIEAFADQRTDTLAANSYFYIGDAYYQLGDLRKALNYLERERQVLHSLGTDKAAEYNTSLSNLAYLYLQNGDYAKAGITADELISNHRKVFAPDSQELIESVISVADIYIQLDRFRDAENLLTSTLKRQKKNSDRAQLLNKLGDLYTYTGQYSKASVALTDALDIHLEEGGEESVGYINAAINLGILYVNQGKYPEAEEIFEIALKKIDPSQDAYSSLLNNQAVVHQSLGQLDRAEKTFLEIKSIDSVAVGAQHPDFAITLSNLGLVYADLGELRKAEEVLTRALAIQKANGEAGTLSYARKLNNLAKVYQLAGNTERSVALVSEAMAIFKKTMGRHSPEYATSAYNLGVALWKSGKPEAGIKRLRTSASIRKKALGKQHPQYTQSLLKIAEYQWYKKSIRDSRRSFGEVFENYFFQIDQTFPVLTEEEKAKFYYTNIREAFDKFNSLAIEHYGEEEELAGDMYNYLINTKGAIMVATEKVKASVLWSGDSILIRQFDTWQSTKEQIARLYSLSQANEDLDSLLELSRTLEKDLGRRSATFQNQLVRKRHDFRHIQKNLSAGEAAVEVLRYRPFDPKAGGEFKGTFNYVLLVLTADTMNLPTVVSIPGGEDLEGKYLKFYRNSIKYNMRDDASYKNYFEPLARVLREKQIKRIYFSPDGVYNQINLNSLQDPQTNRFVLDEFDVRMVTNTNELLEASSGSKKLRSSALIGFPQYNLDETFLTKAPDKKVSRGGVNRAWRGGLLRYFRGDNGISVLPGTGVEIQKIAALFGEGSTVYTKEEATERIARKIQNPNVLHIATHGYFLQDELADATTKSEYYANPLLNAGLILAGAENFLRTGTPLNADGDDGILTAYEAMNLNLDSTQLVVLSACETALGDVRNGEGVYGLQRAFKLAGTESIVMSLWSVDDEATQQLMTTFYEQMIVTGDQHMAFRLAQQKVKEVYPSPFFWGAFIMVGI